MSIIFHCDACSSSSEPHESGSKLDKPASWVHITPGYIGTKLLCRRCWDRWGAYADKFFRKPELDDVLRRANS